MPFDAAMLLSPETLLRTVLAGLLGLIVGSFLGMAAYRMPRGLHFGGRSACPSCTRTLGVVDLVPVLSWVLLKRRCRRCSAPVPGRYTAIEATTGGLFAALALLPLDWPVPAVPLMGLAAVLVLLSAIDLEHFYLPDSLVLLTAALAAVPIVTGDAPADAALLGAGLLGGGAWLLRSVGSRLAGREALGLGDVKLMAAAGLWLGPWAIPPFLFLAGCFGLALAGLRRLKGSGADGTSSAGPEIPFGPAIAAALLILSVAAAIDR